MISLTTHCDLSGELPVLLFRTIADCMRRLEPTRCPAAHVKVTKVTNFGLFSGSGECARVRLEQTGSLELLVCASLHIYDKNDTLLWVRTTLVIEDGLFRQIKKKAAEQGRTLQAVVNDLLRRALVQTARQPYRLNLKGWQANEQPGVDLLDRDKLFDLMDGR